MKKILLEVVFFIIVTIMPFLLVYPVYLHFKYGWILFGYTVIQLTILLFIMNNKKISGYLERKGVIKRENYKGGA